MNASDKFFILEDTIFPNFVTLDAGFSNPYIEKIQYYMDLSFQAGLNHAWEIMAGSTLEKERLKNVVTEIESGNILTFKDILIAFYILPVGYALAILVFLGEVYFHDFLLKFPMKMYRQRYNDWMRRVAWTHTPKNIEEKMVKKVNKAKIKIVKPKVINKKKFKAF
jgi:hypothetical protein